MDVKFKLPEPNNEDIYEYDRRDLLKLLIDVYCSGYEEGTKATQITIDAKKIQLESEWR